MEEMEEMEEMEKDKGHQEKSCGLDLHQELTCLWSPAKLLTSAEVLKLQMFSDLDQFLRDTRAGSASQRMAEPERGERTSWRENSSSGGRALVMCPDSAPWKPDKGPSPTNLLEASFQSSFAVPPFLSTQLIGSKHLKNTSETQAWSWSLQTVPPVSEVCLST